MANRATGAVTRLYVTEGRTYIRLQIPVADQPKDGCFKLLEEPRQPRRAVLAGPVHGGQGHAAHGAHHR